MTFTADLCDAHPNAQVLELDWRGFGAVSVFDGPAVTLALYEDNSLVGQTLHERGQGRVLVVDGGGSRRRALVGDNLAQRAADNGWAGIVVYGCIRDAAQIESIAIGIKALGTHPRKTDKRGEGRRDVEVRFGGVSIRPGDHVYADRDGVVVL
ncbi:MAG: ribonuclease E activity regulator RraA [Nannocystaceae bacterium]|nr:ribonuclease E activity regulator RraA [bacterium]